MVAPWVRATMATRCRARPDAPSVSGADRALFVVPAVTFSSGAAGGGVFVAMKMRRDGARCGGRRVLSGQRARSRRLARSHRRVNVPYRRVCRFFAGQRTTSWIGPNANRSVGKPRAPFRQGAQDGDDGRDPAILEGGMDCAHATGGIGCDPCVAAPRATCHALKVERVDHSVYDTRDQARRDLFTRIEGVFN